jgi:hypothetical protein
MLKTPPVKRKLRRRRCCVDSVVECIELEAVYLSQSVVSPTTSSETRINFPYL